MVAIEEKMLVELWRTGVNTGLSPRCSDGGVENRCEHRDPGTNGRLWSRPIP